jgi:hypothetical protein
MHRDETNPTIDDAAWRASEAIYWRLMAIFEERAAAAAGVGRLTGRLFGL